MRTDLVKQRAILRMQQRIDTVQQLRALVAQQPAATLEVTRCWMQQRGSDELVG